MNAELQPAWILHRRAYRDTSLLLDCFTRYNGRLPVVARGGRKRKGLVLDPFRPMLIALAGRGEVKTLRSAEPADIAAPMQGDALTCGLYVNELLVRLLPQSEAHEVLFAEYGKVVEALASATTAREQQICLRVFERKLLADAGYALQLTHEAETERAIEPAAYYQYHHDLGPRFAGDVEGSGLVSGAVLLALARGQFDSDHQLRGARNFMRAAVDHRLGGRPLNSRRLWRGA